MSAQQYNYGYSHLFLFCDKHFIGRMYSIYTYTYCIDLFYAVIFVLSLDKGKNCQLSRHLPRHVIMCSIEKGTVPKFWYTLKCKLSEWRNI